MTLSILKKWVTDTLSQSSDYIQLSNNTIGQVLNFYRSAPMNRMAEVIPFMTVYGDVYEADYNTQSEYNKIWKLSISIMINGDDIELTDSNGNIYWEAVDNVEALAYGSIDVLKKNIRCGIQGIDVRILDAVVMVTQIGEADSIQASLFLEIGEINSI